MFGWPDIYSLLAALTALVTATVALVKAVRGDGRKTTTDTPAEKTTK